MEYLVFELGYQGTWQTKTTDGVELTIEGTAKIQRTQIDGTVNVVVEAGKTTEYPVTLRIPTDGPLTGEKLTYYFGVRAAIEGASDPSYKTTFDIKA